MKGFHSIHRSRFNIVPNVGDLAQGGHCTNININITLKTRGDLAVRPIFHKNRIESHQIESSNPTSEFVGDFSGIIHGVQGRHLNTLNY